MDGFKDLRLDDFPALLPDRLFELFGKGMDAEQVLRGMLESLGELTGADGVTIIEKSGAGAKSCAVWRRAGYTQDESLALTWWQDCADVFERAGELCAAGDRFVQCLFLSGGQPAGSVFVESADAREWTAHERAAVSAAALAYGAYLSHMRRLQNLDYAFNIEKQAEFEDGHFSYVIEEDTFKIIYIARRTLALKPDAQIGDVCYEAFMDRQSPCEDCPVLSQKGRVEKFNKVLGGWYMVNARRINTGEDKYAMLITGADITEYKKRMQEADALTGLPGYKMFKRVVAESSAASKRAVVFLDFEKFGDINDSRGLKAGNEILRRFAALLLSVLNGEELLCRYFSDVFLVYLVYDDVERLRARVDDFYEKLSAWNAEYFPDVQLTVKGGVFTMEGAATDVDDIVECANLARRNVAPGERYAIYDEDMRGRVEREADMEKRMCAALENGEFAVYMQPRVDIKKPENIVGCEALIRWQSNAGSIMPMEFIPLFEKNGFIQHMDKYMCDKVFAIIREWLDGGVAVKPVSINISPQNMSQDAFVDEFIELLKKYEIPPYTVELELQDEMFTGGRERIAESFGRLRKMGVMFSVNELGALGFLQTLPIDTLKFDLMTFDHKNLSEKERAMLTHIVRLAKSLDMKVLCTGIEEQAQAEAVRDAGCDVAQGYVFGSPVNYKSFEHMLK